MKRARWVAATDPNRNARPALVASWLAATEQLAGRGGGSGSGSGWCELWRWFVLVAGWGKGGVDKRERKFPPCRPRLVRSGSVTGLWASRRHERPLKRRALFYRPWCGVARLHGRGRVLGWFGRRGVLSRSLPFQKKKKSFLALKHKCSSYIRKFSNLYLHLQV
jgi:hypothetical protein